NAFLNLASDDHALRSHGVFERAVALAEDKRPGEALALLETFRARSAEKKDANGVSLANLQKGNILFNDHEYAAAVTAYRDAGDNPKAWLHQGVALARLEYYKEAVQTWLALAQKFPQDRYAERGLFRAARTQFEMGETTADVQSFTQFAQAYPQS